jgi:MFS transporter, SP family, sugar:H+ symporter
MVSLSGGVTSMESFLQKFFPKVYHQMKGDKNVSNYCRFDSELLTVFTSSLYIAGLVATLFASSVTRRFGRRASILIGGTVFIAGSVFGGAAVNVYMLLLNRILLGIGLGFTNQVTRNALSKVYIHIYLFRRMIL